jgi:hypothetical protein
VNAQLAELGRVVHYRLVLPRWDLPQPKTGRGGWPKGNPTTRKVVKHRPVWDALHANARPAHWAQRHKAVREVIQAVSWAARCAGMRECEHLTVQLVWAPGDRRRADRGNLAIIQKSCVDALARGRSDIPGLRLVPDDTDRWVEELMPRIDRPPVRAGLWLEVVAVGEHRPLPRPAAPSTVPPAPTLLTKGAGTP